MGKCIDWLEKKGYHLLTIFIILQTVIFIAFLTLYSIEQNETDILQTVYTGSILALFLSFMIYFAYHSVYNFHNF